MLEVILVLKKKKEKNGKKKIWIEISKDRKRSLKVKLSRLMAFSRLSFHSRCWKLGNKVIFSFLLGIILEVWKSQRLIFLLKKKKKKKLISRVRGIIVLFILGVSLYIFQIIRGNEEKQVFFKYIWWFYSVIYDIIYYTKREIFKENYVIK